MKTFQSWGLPQSPEDFFPPNYELFFSIAITPLAFSIELRGQPHRPPLSPLPWLPAICPASWTLLSLGNSASSVPRVWTLLSGLTVPTINNHCWPLWPERHLTAASEARSRLPHPPALSSDAPLLTCALLYCDRHPSASPYPSHPSPDCDFSRQRPVLFLKRLPSPSANSTSLGPWSVSHYLLMAFQGLPCIHVCSSVL